MARRDDLRPQRCGQKRRGASPGTQPVTKQLTHQQFWGFWRAHGTGNIGLVATTWVLMSAEVSLLSPNDHPNPS